MYGAAEIAAALLLLVLVWQTKLISTTCQD